MNLNFKRISTWKNNVIPCTQQPTPWPGSLKCCCCCFCNRESYSKFRIHHSDLKCNIAYGICYCFRPWIWISMFSIKLFCLRVPTESTVLLQRMQNIHLTWGRDILLWNQKFNVNNYHSVTILYAATCPSLSSRSAILHIMF